MKPRPPRVAREDPLTMLAQLGILAVVVAVVFLAIIGLLFYVLHYAPGQ